MTMLDTLANALENVDKPGHLLRTYFSKEKKRVYAILEGKDDLSYYTHHIEAVLPDNWTLQPITADNRYQVVKCYQGINWSAYPREQICFFVDKDLSDFTEEPTPEATNLYVTSGYSIENDILSTDVFKRVIREIFGIDKISNDNLDPLGEKCEVALRHFSESLMPLMAQIVFWKNSGGAVSRGLDLDQVKISDLIEISDCCLTMKNTFRTKEQTVGYISEKCQRSPAQMHEIEEILAKMTGRGDPLKIIRGKYLMSAFIGFCLHIGNNIHILFPDKYTKPLEPRVSLTGAPILVVAPRSKTPTKLKSFLKDNYESFINQLELRPATQSGSDQTTPACAS